MLCAVMVVEGDLRAMERHSIFYLINWSSRAKNPSF